MKYGIGTQHKGIVRNLTNFGLFIELEEGIDGLVHVSDLSWTKKIKHPSEFVKVGEELEVMVLELDAEQKRLALGHKQLEENPWNTFEEIFTIGSMHKCTILQKNDKGAVLELPYGIEGFCANKNLKKEDGNMAEVGESLEFRVVEFSKDDKRIILAHSKEEKRTPGAGQPQAAAQQGGGKKGGKPQGGGDNKSVEQVNKENDNKSTLGDLDQLIQLKKDIQKNG
jgi:small subunit ribosomal protein S1